MATMHESLYLVQNRRVRCQSGACPLAAVKYLSQGRLRQPQSVDGERIVEPFGQANSAGDEGYDIFIEPSDLLLHHISHIYGSGARPSVAAMVGPKHSVANGENRSIRVLYQQRSQG
jgi:hypothetical protein